MKDGVIARILREHDHFEHRRLGQDTLGDGALGRGGLDSGHDVGREKARAIGEAVERFDRVDDASLAVILQRFLWGAAEPLRAAEYQDRQGFVRSSHS
jgi:hypothetical protein